MGIELLEHLKRRLNVHFYIKLFKFHVSTFYFLLLLVCIIKIIHYDNCHVFKIKYNDNKCQLF